MTTPPSDPSTDKAAPKKRELPSRKNTSVRNVAWAVGLNLLIVALVAAVIVGLGRPDRDHVSEKNAAVDITATASRAREALGFPVSSAQPSGWTVRDARMHAGAPGAWEVRYTSPAGSLVTLWESTMDQRALATKVPGQVAPGQKVQVAGASCAWLDITEDSSKKSGSSRGLECQGKGKNLVVFGGDNPEHLRELAQQAMAAR